MGGGGGGHDPFDIFQSFFGGSPFGGGGSSRGRRQRRGEDVIHPLKVSLGQEGSHDPLECWKIGCGFHERPLVCTPSARRKSQPICLLCCAAALCADMKTLRRNKEGIYNTAQNYHRKFSAITRGARADRPRPQECLVLVEARDTYTPLLHQILQSCARTGAPMEGKACHGQIIHVGLQADTLTSNMLINMYSKCSLVDSAGKVFDEMPERSLVSWNTMIGSLTQNGEEQKALGLFLQMRREGNHFSEFTVSSVLCACAAKCAVFECKQLHALAVKLAMNLNVYVGTALLDVYAKSGLIKDASSVFA